MKTTRTPAVIGGFLTHGGSTSCRCSRRVNRTPWGVLGPVSRIGRRWLPCASCSAPVARGPRGRRRASAPVGPPLAASKRGRRRASAWGCGRAAWWPMMPGRALTGNGSRWMGPCPTPPVEGKQVGQHPTDRGQIGAKRRVLTAGGGVPIGLAVAGANRHDCKMVRETIESLPAKWPAPTPAMPPGMGLDTGDDDDEVRDWLAEFGCTAHLRGRGEEATALKQDAGCRARWWVVERTPSWMNRFRRVLIRWDKKV